MKSITIRPSDLIGFKPCELNHKDPKHCEDVNRLTKSIIDLDVPARVTIKKSGFGDDIINKTYIGSVHVEQSDYETSDIKDAIATAKIALENTIWIKFDYRMTCDKGGFYLDEG